MLQRKKEPKASFAKVVPALEKRACSSIAEVIRDTWNVIPFGQEKEIAEAQ